MKGCKYHVLMLMLFLAFLNSSPASLSLMGTGAAVVPVQKSLSKLDDRTVSEALTRTSKLQHDLPNCDGVRAIGLLHLGLVAGEDFEELKEVARELGLNLLEDSVEIGPGHEGCH